MQLFMQFLVNLVVEEYIDGDSVQNAPTFTLGIAKTIVPAI